MSGSPWTLPGGCGNITEALMREVLAEPARGDPGQNDILEYEQKMLLNSKIK